MADSVTKNWFPSAEIWVNHESPQFLNLVTIIFMQFCKIFICTIISSHLVLDTLQHCSPLPTYTIDQNQRPGYTSNYLINTYLHFGLSENSKSSIKTEEFYRHFLVIKSILHRLKKFEF